MKRFLFLLILTGSLWAYEDVCFSTLSMGMGGTHTIFADNLASSAANPAFAARFTRTRAIITGAMQHSLLSYGLLTFSQPVKSLGNIGAGFLYYPCYDTIKASETDLRVFWAIPLGPYINIGATVGNHNASCENQDTTTASAYSCRPEPGSFFSLGLAASLPKGLAASLSLKDMGFNFAFKTPTTINAGLAWKRNFKHGAVFSSALIAAEAKLLATGSIGFNLGAEGFVLNDILGFRAGIGYSQKGISPTVGLTLRTRRIEKTDFELHYALAFIPTAHHQLSLSLLFGDARKEEKDSIKAHQQERARRLREQALARERDKLRQELNEINQERSALEKERKGIERIRAEALDKLSRTKGIDIASNDSTIQITLTETVLKFADDSAEIPFPEGYNILSKIGLFLQNYPKNRISISVYSSPLPALESGKADASEENGEELTTKTRRYKDAASLNSARAKTIKTYFARVYGVKYSLLSAKGVVDSEPSDNQKDAPLPKIKKGNRVVILIQK